MKRWVYLAFNGTAYSNFSQWNQVLGLLRPRNVWFHCLQRTFKLANDNYTSLFDKYTFLFPFFFYNIFLKYDSNLFSLVGGNNFLFTPFSPPLVPFSVALPFTPTFTTSPLITFFLRQSQSRDKEKCLHDSA